MKNKLWRFTDNFGSFESQAADKIKSLYFPLCNETIMSSITSDLRGDIKTSQNSFLLTPVSRIDLTNSKESRNFWVYIDKDKIWSATGVCKNLSQIYEDKFNLKAGLLWQEIERANRKIGLKAEILSFVPATGESVEIMQVKLTNISSQRIKFTPTAAIPIYARAANNLRDHRHVTSLLQRIILHKFGVIVKPTLVFDETGHKPNKTLYFVLGWDEDFVPPQYLYPTQEMFCGDEGDLEAPASILRNTLPDKENIQGKEAMGALRFHSIILNPEDSHSYIILMGIVEDKVKIKSIINEFNSLAKVKASFEQTKDFWISNSKQIDVSTGDPDFDNWLRWVSIQPTLRRIYGCSFLPDFDYGKGGRGWRDLWQDLLVLALNNPEGIRKTLINNFSGVRIDGSNATIISKGEGEFTPLETGCQRQPSGTFGALSLTGFISDRNNISRVWMDHGVWPLITLDLFINETGDKDILFEETAYFRDHQTSRSREIDKNWDISYANKLKTSTGKIYKGTILEHLLVQNLVQFFNVGRHNYIRLEDGDWNDGLDMAKENGESIAFSAMYAYNLKVLSGLLLKTGKNKLEIAEELNILLQKINYNDIRAKLKILNGYFNETKSTVSGRKIKIDAASLAEALRLKSDWISKHIRKTEWLERGFFNGYYDNKSTRVEGIKKNVLRMILTSQVFPIMSGVADDEQIKNILKNVQKYIFNKDLKGFHLNSNFRQEQHNLGRALSFVYGDKENGAFFNHMVVMFAYGLYKRGYVLEGWRVLNSIYNMAVDTEKSKIYPCLPEYFNLDGRGMYSYLTGSASWFVLTLLTQVFGVRGIYGDLFIEPKLTSAQFRTSSNLSINRIFCARRLKINFFNPKGPDYPEYKIIRATLNSQDLRFQESQSILIKRKIIQSLPSHKLNTLNIILG